jgi:hypothetical protein
MFEETPCPNLVSIKDQTAKKMFNDLNRQLEDIVQALKGRVNYVEKQEPQYKMNQDL